MKKKIFMAGGSYRDDQRLTSAVTCCIEDAHRLTVMARWPSLLVRLLLHLAELHRALQHRIVFDKL